MIVQAKDLKRGMVIYLPSQKVTTTVTSVDFFSHKTVTIFTDSKVFSPTKMLKLDLNKSIPVIGQSTEVK